MLGLVAQVVIEGATVGFDKLYTYSVPPSLQNTVLEGKRAVVPFGRGNTRRQCMILHTKEAEIKSLKSIISVSDEEPLLNAEMIALCEYMRESVFCTYYDAISVMLPAGLSLNIVDYYSANDGFEDFESLSENEKEIYNFLKANGEKSSDNILKVFSVAPELLPLMANKGALIKSFDTKRKMGDAMQKWVRIADDFSFDKKLTSKQNDVMHLINDAGEASIKEVCYFTGVTPSVVTNLVNKGYLTAFEKQFFRVPKRVASKKEEIILTKEQNTAFMGLLKELEKQTNETALLYGVTGSGKTQVFLKLADKVIEENKGVIVMVPEIALTPQLVSIFTARYGEKVAVFHSAMSMGQRMDEWRRIKNGQALIAIGTRSAVFAPFSNLGLIIIDEEQEHTYKSEKTPRFHAREIAKFRSAYHKALLLLASATPSVETYTKAKNGAYSLFTLNHRYGNAILPETEIVDMKAELSSGNSGCISNTLYEALKETLDNKNQAIILLNRRGHNTYVSCSACGYVASCPNCSVSLTYHSANKRLMCHYCGYSEEVKSVCPECENPNMKFSGLGTQKAADELALLFPDAHILRLDADSTSSRDSHSEYLEDFKNGKYDILIGTQMVAKGLDFPNVTLVGVLGADSAMESSDYKAFERTFSLLTQVIGRAGRGDAPGRAIIQTSSLENSIITLASEQDYDSFYNEEIINRKLMIYPPYCDICALSVQSTSQDIAQDSIMQIFENIKSLISDEFKDIKVIILGPAPANIMKVNNKYRFRMIIKCKNGKRFREMLRRATQIKQTRDAAVYIDINPESII